MEKNKQDTNDIGNTNHKNENPFKATNPPGKKKKMAFNKNPGSGDGPWRKSQASDVRNKIGKSLSRYYALFRGK